MHSGSISRIALLCATQLELDALAGCRFPEGAVVRRVVTGMGAGATAAATLRILRDFRPDLAVQVGIAGAVSRELPLCEVVAVGSDRQADLGAWRGDRFEAFGSEWICSPLAGQSGLQVVSARSVNTACTPVGLQQGEIETMEGAAFFEVCAAEGVDFLQIRSLSNYVGDPRPTWRIGEALAALTPALERLFSAFE